MPWWIMGGGVESGVLATSGSLEDTAGQQCWGYSHGGQAECTAPRNLLASLSMNAGQGAWNGMSPVPWRLGGAALLVAWFVYLFA